jgi:hypothetical protein
MTCCNDRRRLAEQFAVAAREHSDAVVRLVQHEGPSSHAEYNRLRTVVTEAYERCDNAGTEFEQHVTTHGCGVITKESRVFASTHVAASAEA